MSDETPLKQRLRSDLTAAMKDRDKLRSGTLRMVISAISEAEKAGDAEVELSNEQVLDVLINQAKRRREAEAAYVAAGRDELAAQERAESGVLADYLPQAMGESELQAIVADAIEATGARELGMRGLGKVMSVVTPRTKGKADGAVVAAEVRRQLQG